MPTNYADESDVRAVLAQLMGPANRALRMGTAADPFARMVWADLFDDMGRSHEAALLRDPTRHVMVTPAGEVVPARFNRPGLDAMAERLSQVLESMGVGDDYSNMASVWREQLEMEPEPLRAEDLQHLLADHFYHGVLHSGPMADDLLTGMGMEPPDWPAVAQDMRRMLMDYPYEEPDPEAPAPTAYGTREDLLGAIAQNPWESDIHARLSDWEGEYGDPNEAAFRAKVAQWLPERVRFGANPTPEIGNVLPWIHGPYQGFAWGDRPPHHIHTWFEDEDLIGGGRRRLLVPRFDSRSQPVWARFSSDPLSPSAANEAFFALPRGGADSLSAIRAALPEFDFNAHENRPLNDAEQAYIGLAHLDPDTDPEIWPQLEAILRERNRRGLRFGDDQAPTNYADREELEARVAADPWEVTHHDALWDFWQEHAPGSPEERFRGGVAAWIKERPGAPKTRSWENMLGGRWWEGPHPGNGFLGIAEDPFTLPTWEARPNGTYGYLLKPYTGPGGGPRPMWNLDFAGTLIGESPYTKSEQAIAAAFPPGTDFATEFPHLMFRPNYGRPLNDAEYEYLLGDFDPKTTDPAIWPQIEAILRDRSRRGQRFADDESPTNYGDRESLEAAILQNPLEPDIHLRLADLHAEQGDDLHARFRQAVGEGLHRRLITPFTPSSFRDNWDQPLHQEWRPGSHAWASPPRISLWFPEGPRHNPYMGPNPYVNSWIPWQPLDGDAWAWGYEPMSGTNVEARNIRSALGLSPWLEPDFAEDFPQWRNDVWSSARSPSWGAPGGGVDLYDPDSPNWLNHAEMNAFGLSDISEMDPALWPQVEAILRREFARGRTEFSGDGEPTEYGPPSPFVRPEDPVRYPPFIDHEKFVPYGDREELEARVIADPLELTHHMALNDFWQEHAPDSAEASFRANLLGGVRRRMTTPFAPPPVDGAGWLLPGAPHGVARNQPGGRPDLPSLRTASRPDINGERNINHLVIGLSNGDYFLNAHPEGTWAWDIGSQSRFYPFQGEHSLRANLNLGPDEDPEDFEHPVWQDQRRTALVNGQTVRLVSRDASMILRPEERLWAGVDDWQNTNPAVWPALEALLRRQHGRGERLESDEAPTNYGDLEDLHAQMLQNPWESDIHLRLADAQMEAGNEAEGLFREKVGRWLPERFRKPPVITTDQSGRELLWADRPADFLHVSAFEPPFGFRTLGPEATQHAGAVVRWTSQDWGQPASPERLAERLGISRDEAFNPQATWDRPALRDRPDVWYSPHHVSRAVNRGERAYLGMKPAVSLWSPPVDALTPEADPVIWPQIEALLRQRHRMKKDFAGGEVPTNYSDREALEAAIRANPLDVDPHLMLADWHRESGDEAEGDFRELVGRSVQRRLENLWQEWEEGEPGGAHGPVDPFRLPSGLSTSNRWWNSYPVLTSFAPSLLGLSSAAHAHPWYWASGPDLTVARPPFEIPTISDLYRDRGAGRWPGTAGNWGPYWESYMLSPPERFYAGINDLTTIPPEMWPLVEQIMRQQHGRGLRFEDSEMPTNYGDVEDLRAQMMLDPRVSDVHLRLADALREAGDETEGDFSEAVGRSLQRRFSQPWQPPTFDRWGFLHQGKSWMPEDDYEEHVTGDPMETGWGTYAPSTTHHVMWPALSGAHNTQLIGNSGWGQPPRGEMIWDFAHEHGGLSGPDRLDLMPHIDWPATLSDLPILSAWRNGRWAHQDVEAPWIRPDEMDHPDAHPHVMSLAERLFSGTMDPGAISPRNWPQLEALMREMHSRGVRFQGGRPTAYSHEEGEGLEDPEEPDPMEPEEPEESEEYDYGMWDPTDSDIPYNLRPQEVISDLSAFYETEDGDTSEVIVESAAFNWNGDVVTAYRWRDWDGVNDYGGWTLDRNAAAADAQAEADARHVEPNLQALDLVRELFPEADKNDEGDWVVNMAGRQLAFEARRSGELILNFFNDANQETEATASAKDLRAGSIDLMRAIRRVAQEAMRRGIPFGYGVPSDKRRARMYGEFLAAGGYVPREKLSRNSIVWEPSDGTDPARDAARVRQYFETIDRYGVVNRYAGPAPVPYHDPSAAVRYAVVSRLFQSRVNYESGLLPFNGTAYSRTPTEYAMSPDLSARLESLRPDLAAAAQRVYDAWNPDPDRGCPTYGPDGICAPVAEAMQAVLARAGLAASLRHDHDDSHTSLTLEGPEAVGVDIPWRRYELNGYGAPWGKIPGVVFAPEDLVFRDFEGKP